MATPLPAPPGATRKSVPRQTACSLQRQTAGGLRQEQPAECEQHATGERRFHELATSTSHLPRRLLPHCWRVCVLSDGVCRRCSRSWLASSSQTHTPSSQLPSHTSSAQAPPVQGVWLWCDVSLSVWFRSQAPPAGTSPAHTPPPPLPFPQSPFNRPTTQRWGKPQTLCITGQDSGGGVTGGYRHLQVNNLRSEEKQQKNENAKQIWT